MKTLVRAPARRVLMVPPGLISILGYSTYFEDFVSSYLKLLTSKTHTHTKIYILQVLKFDVLGTHHWSQN